MVRNNNLHSSYSLFSVNHHLNPETLVKLVLEQEKFDPKDYDLEIQLDDIEIDLDYDLGFDLKDL